MARTVLVPVGLLVVLQVDALLLQKSAVCGPSRWPCLFRPGSVTWPELAIGVGLAAFGAILVGESALPTISELDLSDTERWYAFLGVLVSGALPVVALLVGYLYYPLLFVAFWFGLQATVVGWGVLVWVGYSRYRAKDGAVA